MRYYFFKKVVKWCIIINIYSKQKEKAMPAKPSGQIKTSTIKKLQKNGDIYILERRTIYAPEKKYNLKSHSNYTLVNQITSVYNSTISD